MTIRPSAASAALAALIVAGVCIRLGFWQLDRLDQRRALNAAITAAAEMPPLELDAVTMAAIGRDPPAFVHRQATARGEFLHGREVLLRGRSHAGRPGVHIVTPLVLAESGEILLVNLGWIPSPDAATADPREHRVVGPATVHGILQAVPVAPDDASLVQIDLVDTTVTSYRRLDRGTLAGELGALPAPLYLQITPSPNGGGTLPIAVPPPVLDEGSHLGYAIQWFAFAAIALGGLVIVSVRSRYLS